jgi:hypothetical protein
MRAWIPHPRNPILGIDRQLSVLIMSTQGHDHVSMQAKFTVHRRTPNPCGRTRAKSARCGHLHPASCLKMQKIQEQTGANVTASATKLGTSVGKRTFKAWLLTGVALHRAKWVVPLVRVLLQAFFACLSCLSFELDAMLSMATLKRDNSKDSKHLCPTDSETLTNASWLDTRTRCHGPLLAVTRQIAAARACELSEVSLKHLCPLCGAHR